MCKRKKGREREREISPLVSLKLTGSSYAHACTHARTSITNNNNNNSNNNNNNNNSGGLEMIPELPTVVKCLKLYHCPAAHS